jgi:regulator of nonsense transcripts 1
LDEREDRLGKIDNSDVVSQASLSEISQDTDNNSVDPYANVQPYDFEKLPSHKCAYCGVHEPNSVVKCLAKDCNKWFCNGKGLNEYGSHIILHLAKRKHKEISLHPDSELKDVNLACHTCNSKNIFMLGYTPAKTDFYAILLCREPCLKNLS